MSDKEAILRGAYQVLQTTYTIDESKLAYYMSQVQLDDGHRLVEYELLTPVTQTRDVIVSAVTHCCDETKAQVYHVKMTIDPSSGRVMEQSKHNVGTIPWDVVTLVNILNHRPPIQYRQDSLQPNPLEYPLDPVDQGHHSLLPLLDPVGSSSR